MTARHRARAAFARVVTVGLVAVPIVAAAGCGADADAGPSPAATAAVSGAPGPATAGTGDGDGEATSPPATPAAAPPTGTAPAPYCGASRYVQAITVERWAEGEFRISVRPTQAGRDAPDKNAAATEMWEATRACVTGLAGETADSLADQLRCHEFLALVPDPNGQERYATGETYDVESWRPTPGRLRWLSTQCGNTLGTDPTSPSVEIYRPDGVPPGDQTSGERD